MAEHSSSSAASNHPFHSECKSSPLGSKGAFFLAVTNASVLKEVSSGGMDSPCHSRKASLATIAPVMASVPGVGLISMFKKTKRNTEFKMTIDLEKKIPRLDTIEMLEDSYETSIIEYLAQEFTNEILSNPNLIRDKIIEELKSMLEGNVKKPSKSVKKEEKVEEKVKVEDKIESIPEDKNKE